MELSSCGFMLVSMASCLWSASKYQFLLGLHYFCTDITERIRFLVVLVNCCLLSHSSRTINHPERVKGADTSHPCVVAMEE